MLFGKKLALQSKKRHLKDISIVHRPALHGLLFQSHAMPKGLLVNPGHATCQCNGLGCQPLNLVLHSNVGLCRRKTPSAT